MLIWEDLLRLYRAKIVTVEIAVFLFIVGKALYIPLSEQYYYHRFGVDILQNTSFVIPNGSFCVNSTMIDTYTHSNSSYKLDETLSNHLVIYTQIANTVPSILVTLLFGPLTDRFGRRIGIIIPSIGMALQCVVSIIVVVYSLHPYYFILANFISGVCGNVTCLLAASFSYVADVSPPRWRSLRMGIVEAGLAFGGFVGYFLEGYWLDKVNCNYLYPLIFCGSCNILIVVYIAVLVPESLSSSERHAMRLKNPRGLASYFESFKLYCGGLSLPYTWKLYVATIAANVAIFNIYGASFVNVFFLKALPFDFDAKLIGLFQALRSASQGIANVLITGVLVTLKVGDGWIMLIANLVNVGSNVLIGFSKKHWQLFAIVSVKGIEGIIWSGARGLMSKLVKPQQQGALFSIVASLESLASLLSTVVWPLLFPLTLQHNMRSGMIYIIMAAVAALVVPLIISILFMKTARSSSLKSSNGEYKPLLGKNHVINS